MSRRIAGHIVTPLWVAAAAGILAATITLAAITATSGWFVALGLVGPDLAFLLAIGQKVPAPGRVPARVIPAYNALHGGAGPLILGAIGVPMLWMPPLGAILAVIALGWLCHVVWDRSVGYGLRDRNGAITSP